MSNQLHASNCEPDEETSMSDTNIRIRDHGPLVVEGPFALTDADGNAFPIDSSKPAIALCRCGASKNRPFCDGSHKACGFEAAERAPSS
jgi:CDGSH-type Zn-finger protein